MTIYCEFSDNNWGNIKNRILNIEWEHVVLAEILAEHVRNGEMVLRSVKIMNGNILRVENALKEHVEITD